MTNFVATRQTAPDSLTLGRPTSVDPENYGRLLMEMLPSHPRAHIRLTSIGINKKPSTLRMMAKLADYDGHIAFGETANSYAIGVLPTSYELVGDRKSWASRFMVLDFDRTKPDALLAFVQTLEGLGIYSYLTQGTTGRGSHLIVLFDQWIPQQLAYQVGRALAGMAQEVGLERPELRPSSERAQGMAILLPYRGALRNGFGFNPFLDPNRSLARIHLADTPAIHRTDRAALEQLAITRLTLQPRPERSTALQRSVAVRSPEGDLEARELLQAEFTRVAPVWASGRPIKHRQDLVMGLSAFALRGLGMPRHEVQPMLEAFLKEVGDNEPKRRLDAFARTAAKHERGLLVAWHAYYKEVEVEPPTTSRIVTHGVLAKLAVCLRMLQGRSWNGNSGKSDRCVYAALLELAATYGTEHAEGVLVSVSTRDLAVHANVSRPTLRKAMGRMACSNLVRRHDRGGLDIAGIILLLVQHDASNLTHSSSSTGSVIGGLNEWVSLDTHPAFRRKFLNATAVDVVHVLQSASVPLTLPQINTAVGKNRSKACAKLVSANVIVEDDGRYSCPPDLYKRLDRAAETSGALQAREGQRLQYEDEREANRIAMFKRKLVNTTALRAEEDEWEN